MSELATYSFLPLFRQGIANQIQPTSQAGGRATIPVDLVLSGETIEDGTPTRLTIHKDIQLYGPGDVIGLDQRAILKAEPRNWITNFEPNYLPFIEFYDEDLPWRYSPSPTPTDHRLIPWLALIVLEEGEFAECENRLETPLPFITLTAPEPLAVLPPSDQLWAWAHVQVNRELVNEIRLTNSTSIEGTLKDALAQNPDLAYSRLLCPRRLRSQAAYTAFVVPVFENGRQAGLGVKPQADWNKMSWGANLIPDRLPYYHRWYFRTGTVGDFEYLVRLLEPKPVDSRVGVRSMDVQKPGANLKGITDPALDGVLKLGGALQIPRGLYTPAELTEVEKYESWATPHPHPFQKSLAAFINLAHDYQTQSAETANTNAGAKVQEEIRPEPDRLEEDQRQPPVAKETHTIGENRDPLITAPLYGQWHSLTQRLLEQPDGSPVSNPSNWIHQLNLDPRWRASAGLGTKVVQQNQETYLKAAWDQLGAVLEANKKIRAAQLALAVSQVWYTTHLRRINEVSADQWLTLAAPLSKRILLNGKTIFQTIRQSNVPLAATSVPMRQLIRPRGPLAKRLGRSATSPSSRLLSRLAMGEITAAPPINRPTGAILLQSIAELVQAAGLNHIPQLLKTLKDVFPTLKEQWDQLEKLLPAYMALSEDEQIKHAQSIVKAFQHPDWIDQLPGSSNFRLIEPGSPNYQFEPTGSDNELAKQYKQAMRELLEMIQRSRKVGTIPPKPVLAIDQVSRALLAGTDPALTIPRWTWSGIQLPERFQRNQQEPLAEVMAYPEFDLPMYKPLAALSSEFFLPNINYLAQNSISLLETNQPFIEAYMVGLNHEFARELLWREYPTDQRGSYFRQFWGVNDFTTNDPLTTVERRENIKIFHPCTAGQTARSWAIMITVKPLGQMSRRWYWPSGESC